jgi:hypothetical protein
MHSRTIVDSSGVGLAADLEIRQEEGHVVCYHMLVPFALRKGDGMCCTEDLRA